MKSAAVLTVDRAFALFLDLCGNAWQLKCPSPRDFSIHSKRMLMPCPEVHRVGGGMLGGVGSPKIDWCIIVALLLIQALVEDQVHHPSDFGAQAIAITDNEDQEPIHSPNQITAVLNLVPVCSTPEGRRQNPCLLLIFFWGVFTWAKIIGFFCYLKPVPYVTCFSCWLLLNCFHNLNASFWTVNHSLALRLIQIALSLEYIKSIFTLEWE